jgi:hypothetical protein
VQSQSIAQDTSQGILCSISLNRCGPVNVFNNNKIEVIRVSPNYAPTDHMVLLFSQALAGAIVPLRVVCTNSKTCRQHRPPPD